MVEHLGVLGEGDGEDVGLPDTYLLRRIAYGGDEEDVARMSLYLEVPFDVGQGSRGGTLEANCSPDDGLARLGVRYDPDDLDLLRALVIEVGGGFHLGYLGGLRRRASREERG